MIPLLRTAWTKCSKGPIHTARRCRSTTAGKKPSRRDQFPEARNPGALRLGFENEGALRRGQYSGSHSRRNYQLFQQLVNGRLNMVLERMGRWDATHDEYRSFGLNSQSDLDRESGLFRKALAKSFEFANAQGLTGRRDNPLFWNLRNAFVRSDAAGLARELKYAFQTFILRNRFPQAITDIHHQLADIRFPYEWYPETRMMQRTVHLHVGPTNSGKTYNALKALEAAQSGIYAGPLRLLAHEIYTRFQAKGKPIALVTGEEQRLPENTDQFFQSCTVEMAPLNRLVDVAIIDEIQMIADDDRGWAWTQAFLGLQAKELHVCGEERAVELIQALCARIGDKCVVHHYKRLNPLQTMQKSLGGEFLNLRKGDAVVSFSRIGLHSLKAGIEQSTGRRCAIVYGALPPETRVQQAALFNDPDNDYDFLVASDAIGMGMNLEIKRVIFESAQKFDGLLHRNLTIPEVKQIGGRAGRYRTANQDIQNSDPNDAAAAPAPALGVPGFVSTLDDEDLTQVRQAFEKEAPPIQTAGLHPPSFIIERFFSYFPPNTPFSFVVARLRELSRLSETFHMCSLSDMIEAADAIQEFSMSIQDRITLLSAPLTLRDVGYMRVLKACARAISEMKGGHLLDIKEIDLDILGVERKLGVAAPKEYLGRLESVHKAITLYLWLTYRFQGVFPSQHLAFHVKSLVEENISKHLETVGHSDERRRELRRQARIRAEKHRRKGQELLDEEGGPEEEEKEEAPGIWIEEPPLETLVRGPTETQVLDRGAAEDSSADSARV